MEAMDGVTNSVNMDVDYISYLNEDCLIRIFDELNFDDLLKMSDINVRFNYIINQNIIGHRTFDFSQIQKIHSISKIFHLFGPNITKIKISLKDINSMEILELIRCYFSTEQLRALELESSSRYSDFYYATLERFAPMLSNLHTLTLIGASNKYLNLSDISMFFQNSTNLVVLHLKYVEMKFRSYNLTVRNLSEITIEDCRGLDDQFEHFLIRHPNLKTFGYKSTSRAGRRRLPPMDALLETIIKILPNLESLFFEIETETNEDFPYELILNLKQLKCLKIVSCEGDCVDVYEFLRKLAIQNIVEELTITIKARVTRYDATKCWAGDFPVFSSLRSLEIVNPNRKTENFLIHFVQNSINLTKCTFRSTSPILQSLIYNVALHTRELRLLLLRSPRTGIHNIYKVLLSIFSSSNVISREFCVNEAQFRQYFNSRSCRLYNPKVLKMTCYYTEN